MPLSDRCSMTDHCRPTTVDWNEEIYGRGAVGRTQRRCWWVKIAGIKTDCRSLPTTNFLERCGQRPDEYLKSKRHTNCEQLANAPRSESCRLINWRAQRPLGSYVLIEGSGTRLAIPGNRGRDGEDGGEKGGRFGAPLASQTGEAAPSRAPSHRKCRLSRAANAAERHPGLGGTPQRRVARPGRNAPCARVNRAQRAPRNPTRRRAPGCICRNPW